MLPCVDDIPCITSIRSVLYVCVSVGRCVCVCVCVCVWGVMCVCV
jgi:hypothetical protein